MEDVGIFYCHLVSFTAIMYILLPFGIFWVLWHTYFSRLVCCSQKNLATLVAATDASPCLMPLFPFKV
jgi:hypothetical protein